MSTPAQNVGDAILLGSTGLKKWRKEHGCEEGCDCAACHPLERGLAKLNEALREMGE
jgi:ferredoxin